MRLTCPACGACGSVEFFLMDAAARESVLAAFNLPPILARQVMPYLGLFRPAKRGLTWDKVERLLGELMEAVRAGQVPHQGRAWPAPEAYWKEALNEMLTKRGNLHLPLKSHGYLYSIIAGKSNRAEAAAEQRREEQRRSPRPEGRQGGGPQKVGQALKRSTPPRGWKDEALGKSPVETKGADNA